MHLYLGTFFAPAILFFSLTGALQTFSFHEHRPGETYQPPEWIRVLAQIHKKQTSVLPPAKPGQPERREGATRPDAKGAQVIRRVSWATTALKWFVLLMSIGLMTTTGLGIYMAFKFNPGRRLIWGLLAMGTLLPCAILLGQSTS